MPRLCRSRAALAVAVLLGLALGRLLSGAQPETQSGAQPASVAAPPLRAAEAPPSRRAAGVAPPPGGHDWRAILRRGERPADDALLSRAFGEERLRGGTDVSALRTQLIAAGDA